MSGCTCPDVRDAFRLAAEGHPAPECDVHRSRMPNRESLALNDDAGLLAVISAAVGGAVTETKDLT